MRSTGASGTNDASDPDAFRHSAGPDLESILAIYSRPVESVLNRPRFNQPTATIGTTAAVA